MRQHTALWIGVLFLVYALRFDAAAIPSDPKTTYAYPKTQVIQLDLYIEPSHFMQLTTSDEDEKHPAVVSINAGDMQTIGVQIRGNSSLREAMETPERRIPMELCFDYVDETGSFNGNPSLKLINCSTPAAFLMEYIAMQAFHFLNVPAPAITPAFIRINEIDFGLYLAVEDLNDAFAQAHFGKASLYRPITKQDTENPADQTVSFGDIEMLVKADHGHDTLERYNATLQLGKDAEKYLDVDEILRYMACEAFLLNEDGLLYGDRNFYLADDHGKLSLLPWDLDYAFITLSKGGALPNYMEYDESLFRMLMQNETYRDTYQDYIRMLNEEFLNPDSFLPWLRTYIRFLSPYFRRDVTIPQRSSDVFSDLTTGDRLYSSDGGNLPLTFESYHTYVRSVLSGKSDITTTAELPVGNAQPRKETTPIPPDPGVLYRICANYRHHQRQMMLDLYGKPLAGIGACFAAVFLAAVICVYKPGSRKPRRKR